MKSLRRFIAAATAIATTDIGVANGFVCDIPTAGCTNGMFNQERCECDCISPFCPDSYGDCTVPTNNCGGNPWENCVRGVDCPWYVNPLKAESCTTGPNLPIAMYQIYNTKKACCNTNFAYSTTCDMQLGTSQPTKHPTITAPDDDIFEVIPIKFDVMGLPDEFKMRELKDEMTTVLKRILLRLADRIPGLKVSNVEEKVVLTRNLLRAIRRLKQDVSLYFNVYVIRDDDKKFAPLIINEIRDSYDEVLEQIQTFADTKYFGAELNMNWCTSQNGKFDLCVIAPPPSPPTTILIKPPTPARQPTQLVVKSDPPAESGGGLAGWAIALIVIIVLLLLCCIGYFIFVSCVRDGDEHKEIHNNIYMDDPSSSKNRGGKSRGMGRGDESLYGKSRSRRSRRTRGRGDQSYIDEEEEESNVQIVLAEPQDPKFDEDSFTINTYGTRLDDSNTDRKNKKVARDPTMYIPGQEDKPDPDNDFLMITNGDDASGRRYYSEDPPLKPKRDPTMYVDGHYEPSIATQYMEDPPLKPKRDPTMYVEGQTDPTMYVDGQEDPAMYEAYSVGQSQDPYGMAGIDGSDYDSYGFKASELQPNYMTSDTNAEYNPGRREPSEYFQEDNSFRTQEPGSVAAKSKQSGRSKKSKKSKKSSRK